MLSGTKNTDNLCRYVTELFSLQSMQMCDVESSICAILCLKQFSCTDSSMSVSYVCWYDISQPIVITSLSVHSCTADDSRTSYENCSNCFSNIFFMFDITLILLCRFVVHFEQSPFCAVAEQFSCRPRVISTFLRFFVSLCMCQHDITCCVLSFINQCLYTHALSNYIWPQFL